MIVGMLFGIVGLWILMSNSNTTPQLPLTSGIKPGDALNIEFIDQVGGTISSGQMNPIVLRDGLAYAGIGPRLVILNISEPSNIYVVGQTELIPGYIGEIVLVNQYVYIAPGIYGDNKELTQKLMIVDVSDPTQPHYIGDYAPQNNFVSSVHAFENQLYITTKDENSEYAENIYILDISNPVKPNVIDQYSLKGGISGMGISGGYLYAATYSHGIYVLNISDFHIPKKVGSYPMSYVNSLIVDGGYLYATGETKDEMRGLHSFDISTPEEPRKIATLSVGFIDLVSIYQNIAYVWEQGRQRVVTAIDLNETYTQKRYEFEERVVAIQDGIAFVIDGDQLILFELTGTSEPIKLGSYTTPVPEDIYPEFYLTETKGILPVGNSINIFNLDQPMYPELEGHFSFDYYHHIEGYYGDFALTYSPQELRILDISNPEKADVVWRHDAFDKERNPYLLVILDDYMFIFGLTEGLYTYDMSNPASPIQISHQQNLRGFDGADTYAVSGNFLYILADNEIYILDITKPLMRKEAGVFKIPEELSRYDEIKVIDNLMFLYDYFDNVMLTILDISNPLSLNVITSFNFGAFSDIEGYSKNLVFINGRPGLYAIDFSDPFNPKEKGYYGLYSWGGSPYSLGLGKNNLIYVVGYPNGLYVLKYLPTNK